MSIKGALFVLSDKAALLEADPCTAAFPTGIGPAYGPMGRHTLDDSDVDAMEEESEEERRCWTAEVPRATRLPGLPIRESVPSSANGERREEAEEVGEIVTHPQVPATTPTTEASKRRRISGKQPVPLIGDRAVEDVDRRRLELLHGSHRQRRELQEALREDDGGEESWTKILTAAKRSLREEGREEHLSDYILCAREARTYTTYRDVRQAQRKAWGELTQRERAEWMRRALTRWPQRDRLRESMVSFVEEEAGRRAGSMWRGLAAFFTWNGSWGLIRAPNEANFSLTNVDDWVEVVRNSKGASTLWAEFQNHVEYVVGHCGFHRYTGAMEVCTQTLGEDRSCRVHLHLMAEADRRVRLNKCETLACTRVLHQCKCGFEWQ